MGWGGGLKWTPPTRKPFQFAHLWHLATHGTSHHFWLCWLLFGRHLFGLQGASLGGWVPPTPGAAQPICGGVPVMHNPVPVLVPLQVLLLDEATSALDRDSEAIVQQALDHVMKGRTVLTIAHRLATIQDADRICFIQPRDPKAAPGSPAWYSRLLESGTHAELMQSNGEYARMAQAQQQASNAQCPASGASGEATASGDAPAGAVVQADTRLDTPLRASAAASGGDRACDSGAATRHPVWRTARVNAPEWGWLLLGAIGAGAAGVSYPIYSVLFSEV